MPIAPDGPPPFRADHVGSLLRPAALRHAFRDFLARKIDETQFRSIQDAAIRDVVRLQEEVGLRGRQRRRVPARLVLGPLRRAHRRPRGEAGALQVPRRSRARARLHRAARHREGAPRPADRGGRDRVRARSHEGDAEGDAAGAVDDALLSRAAVRRAGCLREPAGLLRRPRQGLPGGDRRARARRRALRPARRGRARDALRSGGARESASGRRGPGGARRSLRRGDQPGGREPAGGHGDRRAHVPRQLQGPVPCRGRLRLRRRETLQRADVNHFLLEYDTPRAGDFAPLRFLPQTKGVVLGMVSSKVAALEEIDQLQRRADAAAKYVDPDRLAISPQCGFASTVAGNPITEADMRAKLKLCVDAARTIWG